MSAARTRHARGEPRRVLVAVVLAVACAGLVVISLRSAPSQPVAPASSAAAVGISAESTALFCGGLEHTSGVIESDVAIASLDGQRHVAEVTTTNERGQVSRRLVSVRPGRVVHLSPANLVGGSLEAVSIVANGGAVAATESVRGVNGTAVAPCLTRAAPSWWVTGGSTTKNNSFVLSVFNPYDTQADVSLSLLTSAGVTVPNDFQGLVIQPHRLVAIDVRSVAPGVAPITAHVVTSTGDVVVYGVTRATNGGTSIGLLPGTPALDTRAWFPVGSSDAKLTTQLLFANPGASPVDVTVPVWSPPGCFPHCPLPYTVTVNAASTQVLTVSPATRVPAGRGLAAAVQAGGAGLVMVQQVAASGSFGQNAPIADPTLGAGGMLVLVNPLASGFDDVGVVNPSSSTLHLRLETVGRAGPRQIGASYTIAPHDNVELGPHALRGMVGGVLLLVVDGPATASGDVHGAVRGASVLVAVPAS